MPHAILNLDDDRLRSRLADRIHQLRGRYRVEFTKYRPRRSDAQNRYLFGVVYPVIQKGLKEAWGENLSVEEIHLFCKERFASQPMINQDTGEVVGKKIHASSTMTTTEFAEYVDKLILFAAEYFGEPVPSPEEYHG